VAVLGAGFGYVYVTGQRGTTAAKPAAAATLLVATTPAGAAVFVNGEPTGLTTPATPGGLPTGSITPGGERPGYPPPTKAFQLRDGTSVRHQFELHEGSGRLAVAELPVGAVMRVDGTEYAAGEVVTLPVGDHDVSVVLGGKEITRRTIATTSGHQTWELRN